MRAHLGARRPDWGNSPSRGRPSPESNQRVGAVEDRVGDVRDLGARRRGRSNIDASICVGGDDRLVDRAVRRRLDEHLLEAAAQCSSGPSRDLRVSAERATNRCRSRTGDSRILVDAAERLVASRLLAMSGGFDADRWLGLT
jgi:hypothetical protein